MFAIVLHKDGVYNLYSRMSEQPLFESGLTYDQLVEVVKEEDGRRGLEDLERCLKRVHETGSSSRTHGSLESCIVDNRAGEDDSNMPVDEFIQRFLMVQPEQSLSPQ